MRRLSIAAVATLFVVIGAAPAWACAGLINPNGSISLLRTATLSAYVDGVEHYVTSFEFAGGGAEFGSIVPLPGIPSEVEAAGDWTLQRLVQEVQIAERTVALDAAFAAEGADEALVIMETTVDALDITILKGGGDEVARWAENNGFGLSPDAPEILDFYADRSPIFMAARYNVERAEKEQQQIGNGTPVHLAIPTPNPWVPLRILGLGRNDEGIQADVFFLTERRPAMLPDPRGDNDGMELLRDEPASTLLLEDLAGDKAMEWLPTKDMWFSYVKIDSTADVLTFDLATDVSGFDRPSPLAAGLIPPARGDADGGEGRWSPSNLIVIALLVAAAFTAARASRVHVNA